MSDSAHHKNSTQSPGAVQREHLWHEVNLIGILRRVGRLLGYNSLSSTGGHGFKSARLQRRQRERSRQTQLAAKCHYLQHPLHFTAHFHYSLPDSVMMMSDKKQSPSKKKNNKKHLPQRNDIVVRWAVGKSIYVIVEWLKSVNIFGSFCSSIVNNCV